MKRTLQYPLLALSLSLGASALAKSATAKSTNLSANPLGLLAGVANIYADFAVAPAITVGPFLSYTHVTSGTESADGFGVGAKADFYLSSREVFSDSWVAQAFTGFSYASSDGDSAAGLIFGALFGYSWFWASGFNMNLGLGAQYMTLNYDDLGLSAISGFLPALNFSLGYAF